MLSFEAIDQYIIDKVFQPVVNRFSNRVSRYSLGRFFADGVMVLGIFAFENINIPLSVKIICSLILFVPAGICLRLMIRDVELHEAVTPNPARYRLSTFRVSLIVAILLQSLLTIDALLPQFLILICIYIISCEPPTNNVNK